MKSQRRAAVALAALITLSQPAHAGGYVAPVVEIIPPVDMPAAPMAGSNWWLIGGVAALGVLCLLVCGGDDDGVTNDDDDDDNGGPDGPDVTPVPVPAAFLGAATGIAALGGVAIRRRRKSRA